MADYISRDAAVKIAQEYSLVNGDALRLHSAVGDCIVVRIEKLPAADVEPVRLGWWTANCRCSECGTPALLAYSEPAYWKSPYCPSCGAKMQGGENE